VASRTAASKVKVKKVMKKTPGAGDGFTRKPVTKFVTPGSSKSWATTATKKKAKPKGSGVFAAMMMDSDSD
jgi:hypothetical protein